MLFSTFINTYLFRLVKEFQSNNEIKQIRKLITILTDEFAVSHNPHSRKGGLIGLAATAIALGKVSDFFKIII